MQGHVDEYGAAAPSSVGAAVALSGALRRHGAWAEALSMMADVHDACRFWHGAAHELTRSAAAELEELATES